MVGNVPASQYYLLYMSGLGANPAELGFLRSLGLISTSLTSVPAGWLCDRYSVKRILIAGLILHLIVSINFALANNWVWLLPACAFAFIGYNLHREASSLLLVNALKKIDRGMGMGINRALVALPGLVCPFIAAYIISSFGGFNAQGIRPLYYIQMAGFVIIIALMWVMLKDSRVESIGKSSFSGDVRGVFEEGVALKRWIFMVAVLSFTDGMIIPIRPLYLVDVKSADPYILAAMTSAATIILLLFAVPIGRLSDRIGRKKVIFLLRPLLYLSRILIVLAPSPQFLILVGVFNAFASLITVTGVLWITMQMELVEPSRRGIWQGIVLMLRGVFKTPAAIIGGILYMRIDPSILFIAPIIIDMLVIIPILATIPETLNLEITASKTTRTL
ncbi:MAG: MFS transporter [Candidatus Bathyarchaeia archaeon]